MFCGHCGKEVGAGHQFCPHCGQSAATAETTPTTPTPVAPKRADPGWSFGKTMGLGCGGLFALIVLISAIGTATGTKQAPAAKPTAVSVVATAVPTRAATVVPPTATPKPKAPPEVVAYLNYVQPRMQTASRSLTAFSQLTERAQSNPALLGNADWRAQTAIVLGLLKHTGEEFQSYDSPPEEIARLNELFISMGQDLVYAVDEFAAGLDTVNAARFGNTAKALQHASTTQREATTEIQTILSRYGL